MSSCLDIELIHRELCSTSLILRNITGHDQLSCSQLNFKPAILYLEWVKNLIVVNVYTTISPERSTPEVPPFVRQLPMICGTQIMFYDCSAFSDIHCRVAAQMSKLICKTIKTMLPVLWESTAVMMNRQPTIPLNPYISVRISRFFDRLDVNHYSLVSCSCLLMK